MKSAGTLSLGMKSMLVGSFFFAFALPGVCSAATELIWGDEVYDEETWEPISDNRITILNGGSYSVPLNTTRAVSLNNQDHFVVQGTLFFVPDPSQSLPREMLGQVGGYFESDPIAWPSAGTYEIDVYALPPPILSTRTPSWQKPLQYFFGSIAYAQSEGAEYVETIRFTITEEGVTSCVTNCNSSVMFLPGIQSSRLYMPGGAGFEDRLWEPNADGDVQDLYMNPDGSSARPEIYTKVGDILDEIVTPVIGKNVYKSFMADMDDMKSARLINDWAPISYDWRLSLDDILASGAQIGDRLYYSGPLAATSTPYIIQELRRLAATSRTGKVTIVAHSNGGLLAKRLAQVLGDEAGELIDTMILVAVPQAGTPMAIPAGLHGYKQDNFFELITKKSTARTFASTSPMFYNLLPSAGYFTQIDDPVIAFDESLPEWAAQYGSEIHSEELLRNFLIDTYGRVDSQTDNINQPIQLSDRLLGEAAALHGELDSWTPPEGVELIQIAGWGVPKTVSGTTYTENGSGVKPIPTFTIDGDGTVVVPSALWTSAVGEVENFWVDLEKYNKDNSFNAGFGILKISHANILEVEQIRTFILDQIGRSRKTLNQYRYLSIEPLPSTGKRLRFALHSPLTLDLFDTSGNHTGVSTSTGQVEENIPGTYYSTFGEQQYIFAEGGNAYTLALDGYDSGTFTLAITELSGDIETSDATFTDIPVTQETVVVLSVPNGPSSITNLAVDEDGDGEVDFSVSTDGTITATRPIVDDVPQETPSPPVPAEVSSGGNGPPLTETSVVVSTTAATSSPLEIPTMPEAIDAPISDLSTSSTVVAPRIVKAKKIQPVSGVVDKASRPIEASTTLPTKSQTQVAAAAQSAGRGLWSRVYGWIMGKLNRMMKS